MGMRSGNSVLCDTRDREDFPGCTRTANINWFCTVEGRDVSLCNTCNTAWRERARGDENFRLRCPLCIHVYLQSIGADSPFPNAATPVHSMYGPPLTGPIARALDEAMYQEGLLVDVRSKVLRRLGANEAMTEYQA